MGFWIPAFAGMTVMQRPPAKGGGGNCVAARSLHDGGREWIPAFAGTGFCRVGLGLRGLASAESGFLPTQEQGGRKRHPNPLPGRRRPLHNYWVCRPPCPNHPTSQSSPVEGEEAIWIPAPYRSTGQAFRRYDGYGVEGPLGLSSMWVEGAGYHKGRPYWGLWGDHPHPKLPPSRRPLHNNQSRIILSLVKALFVAKSLDSGYRLSPV